MTLKRLGAGQFGEVFVGKLIPDSKLHILVSHMLISLCRDALMSLSNIISIILSEHTELFSYYG